MQSMFPLIIFSTFAWAATLAAAAPIPTAEDTICPYYPTKVGASKAVRFFEAEPNKHDKTYTVTAIEEKNGAKLVTLSTTYTTGHPFLVDPQRITPPVLEVVTHPCDKYLVSKDGVMGIANYDESTKKWIEDDSPCYIFKWPAKPGTEWSYENKAAKYKVKWTVGKPDRVKILAGTFDAIRLHVRSNQNGRDLPPVTKWYAPGIGLIKSKDEEQEFGMEMFSFTEGKKLSDTKK